MLQGLPDDEEVENSSVSWEGGGSAATPKASLGGGGGPDPHNTELTPGRVFCSCRALWAFRAESRAQYVRKAHPEGTGRETASGESSCSLS